MKSLSRLAVLFFCVSALCVHGLPRLVAGSPVEAPSTKGLKVPSDNPEDQYWEAARNDQPINGQVYALAVYNGLLIAGGSFTIPCEPVATNIAAWNGTTWAPLGTGLNGTVNALTVYDSKLIAGGNFTTAGGVMANYIASWNGSSWSALSCASGSPPSQSVKALALYGGKLAVGNDYAIKTWNSGVWETIAYLEPYWNMTMLSSLTVFNGLLIAGGTFEPYYGSTAAGVAAWDGQSWASTGRQFMNVFSLAVYNNRLIVGGWMGLLAAWDGSTWTDVSSPFISSGGTIRSLAVYGDRLIVAGYGSDGTYNNIASSDGSTWYTLGSGTNNAVWALSVYQDAGKEKLAVGGQFGTAGSKTSPAFALWCPPSPTAVLIAQFHARPANDGIALTWTLSADDGIAGIRIYRSRADDPADCVLISELDASARAYIDKTVLPGERYRYTLAVVDARGGEVRSSSIEAGLAPLAAKLNQNVPNPFNPTTSIAYTVPRAGRVTMRIYSSSGMLVRTLIDKTMPAGDAEVSWNGTDDKGARVASGVYFCRFSVDKTTLSRKMLLLK